MRQFMSDQLPALLRSRCEPARAKYDVMATVYAVAFTSSSGLPSGRVRMHRTREKSAEAPFGVPAVVVQAGLLGPPRAVHAPGHCVHPSVRRRCEALDVVALCRHGGCAGASNT